MSRPRPEAGETLVEILVAIVILGVGVATLVGGLGSAIFSSSLHRNQSEIDAVLVSAAETVKGEAYATCATPAAYPPSPTGLYATWAGTLAVTSVRYWNGSGWDTTCDPGLVSAGYDTQLVTLAATSADGQATQSVQLIKALRG